ncbi:L-type lectin-domain containing receptor kinase IX.2-like [Syzygium oleosum]|uniref:L-type lectin-domain containing receptor kinase IX.2-like n=1 Tax=Syzygium oleosum TaxID=219896 RepID=UPI0024BAABA5|nr:L-type lectin-domain containing receptor kinase IX.2-like [Syzygium oleosum]
MKSFGRHKDQPQPPTPTLVLLVLMISLLKPFSAASALHFDNPCFMFPYGFAIPKRLANASERPPYLSPSQPNGRLNGISRRATYSSKVHFWDKATGDVVDCTTQYTASTDSRQGNPFGDALTIFVGPYYGTAVDLGKLHRWGQTTSVFVAPWTNWCTDYQQAKTHSFLSTDASQGHVARPNSDCVAVHVDHVKNTWSVDVPCVGKDSNDPWSMADVRREIVKVMKDGSVAHITYNPCAKSLSVVWRDNDGNSSNEVSRHYDARSSTAYLPEVVGVCVIAPPESAFEYRFAQTSELRLDSLLLVEKVTDSWLKSLLGGVVVLVVTIVAWVNYRSKVSGPETQRGGQGGNRSANLTEEFEKLSGTKKFSYKELMIATDSFARDRILGEGGFGIVYKGHIGGARKRVAVKKLKSGSHRGIKEYISEVKSLSQLRHRNLVQLIGYYHKANEFVLVYEFMSRGSLEDNLFKGRPLLTWERRYNIALGLASAVHYLHKQCNQCVIHRDIKSSNIMLNKRFEAKLGDFGLARLVDHTGGPKLHQKATEVIRTLGYMAPEYYRMGETSTESDVYSFGVVLLEIVCGRRVIEDEGHLVEWVREQYGRGKLPVDSKLGRDFDKKQVKALMIAGLWCAHPNVSHRPSIEEAMAVLNLRADLSNLPSDLRRSQWKVWSRGFRFWANASL